MKIRSKTEYYALLRAGAFLGNPGRQWDSIGECIADGYTGLLGLRHRRRAGDIMNRARLYPFTIEELPGEMQRRGLCLKDFYLSEFFDRSCVTVQGEITTAPYGLHGHLSHTQEILPKALEEGGFLVTDEKHDHRASRLIRQYADDPTWECIHHVLTKYPEHVLEITFVDRPAGVYGWRSIWWEVRSY